MYLRFSSSETDVGRSQNPTRKKGRAEEGGKRRKESTPNQNSSVVPQSNIPDVADRYLSLYSNLGPAQFPSKITLLARHKIFLVQGPIQPQSSVVTQVHLNDRSERPSGLEGLSGWLLMPLRSPLSVRRSACLIVSIVNSPPGLGNASVGLPRGRALGERSIPLTDADLLVGGEVPTPDDEIGDRMGEGDRL